MASNQSLAHPYDYVQIVVDDDWGLVGIVPTGGAGERMKRMSLRSIKYLDENTNEKASKREGTGGVGLVASILNDNKSAYDSHRKSRLKGYDQGNTNILRDPIVMTGSDNNVPNKIAEATVINVPTATRRKPVTRIITKAESMLSLQPQITPAEFPQDSITLSDVNKFSRSNPNVISGMFDSNYMSSKQHNLKNSNEPTSKSVHNPETTNESNDQLFTSAYGYSQMPETLGNISSLAVVRGKDNILIGFGK